MVRLLILLGLFLVSLLCLVSIPISRLLYYVIYASEKSLYFAIISLVFILLAPKAKRGKLIGTITGLLALVVFSLPLFSAIKISNSLDSDIHRAFGGHVMGESNSKPYSVLNSFLKIPKKNAVPSSMVYDSSNGVHLSMDFYQSVFNGLRPCVIMIHGGSWRSGTNKEISDFNSRLAAAGYHIAAINYRLAPGNKFPDQQIDVKYAIDFISKNWLEFRVDTNNLVLMGRSAGGHIALLSAYTLHDKRIKGVISLYGPTNLEWMYQHPTDAKGLNTVKIIEDYLGGKLKNDSKLFMDASPITYVSNQSPPTLLIYGKNDPFIKWEQAKKLDELLEQNKINHHLISLPYSTHAFDIINTGPGGQLSWFAINQFLGIVTKSR